MYRILCVDDPPLIRQRLYAFLTDEPDVHVVELAQDGAQALAFCRESHLDAVVLDVSMPEVSGVVVLATLQQEQPQLPVVMLSTHALAYTVRYCLLMGALGYVAKESAGEALMPALRAVIAGQTYLCRVAQAALDTAR
jgi:DNA-binding NarL/FixJ family response regulator